MKKALKGERLTKIHTGPTSKVVHTKIADAIKYTTKISSTFSHLIENAMGSCLGSQFRKITPYQWMPGLPRCAFVTEIYMNSGIYKTVYGPEMKRSDTYEYDQWRCLNRENAEHFLRSQLCAFVTEIYMNSGIYKTVYGPEMKRSDTYEYDQWRCLNRENVEHFLRSQLSNAKVVQELYNSEGRKNVKVYIFILDSKGHTEYVLLTDDIKEKIKEFIKSPTTKRVAIFVFSSLINYTICPGIGTVIKFVFTNGDGIEASIGEDSFALVCFGFCLRSWREQFHAQGTNNSSMDDIFTRVMKQFAMGVVYRLGANAVKDGAKKLHELYKSTKSKNEEENGGVELKTENVSDHDGEGPSKVNKDDIIDVESTINFSLFESTDDDDFIIIVAKEFAKGVTDEI